MKRLLKIFIMASCSAMIFVQGGSVESKLPGILQNRVMVDYFNNNGFSNTIGTAQHPAGEYYNGVTYVCYQSPLEDPYVASYDHMSGKWLGPLKAGESMMGKPRNANPDAFLSPQETIVLIKVSTGSITPWEIMDLSGESKVRWINSIIDT